MCRKLNNNLWVMALFLAVTMTGCEVEMEE